jgi:hypothetical protein
MTTAQTAESLNEEIQQFLRRVQALLPDIEKTSKKKLAMIFFVYRDAIAPRFIRWLEIVNEGALSDVAKKACEDNLRCEKGEDHPKMLRDFVAPLEKRYHMRKKVAEFMELDQFVNTYRHLNRLAATEVEGLMLMACLENASLVFIPWMEMAAIKLGLTERTYLDKHGVADIAHAQEFIRAAKGDIDCHLGARSKQDRQAVYDQTQQLLFKIFWSPTKDMWW